ncbi:hypothetical protein [Ferrimonas balearica]|uniref:hypothetical protein n=1 Tax=Ferrimonas balearica TaxID=44012 RepID=UPI001F386932|nr:hypothetical protein [Ferrimonas balearica]MBY6093835.1 hypothetical protein [Ferrimonas balearica]
MEVPKPGSAEFALGAMLDAKKRGGLAVINDEDVTALEVLMMDEGYYTMPFPAEILKGFSNNQRRIFCVKKGIYQLITNELVDYLQAHMVGSTIECGSGNGLLADLLAIPATDNRMQEWPEVKQHYAMSGQATIKYGQNVEELEAHAAKEKYNPNTIIACWLTGKKSIHNKPLNMYGPNLKQLRAGTKQFILIGNENVHKDCILFDKACWEVQADWLVSRAEHQHLNRIWIWGQRPQEILGAKVSRRLPVKRS